MQILILKSGSLIVLLLLNRNDRAVFGPFMRLIPYFIALLFHCIGIIKINKMAMHAKSKSFNFRTDYPRQSKHKGTSSIDGQEELQDQLAQPIDQSKRKSAQKIEELQTIERQFRKNVKTIEDSQHAKRFTKLESIKKMKTQGSERKIQEEIKKAVKLPARVSKDITDPFEQGQRKRFHSSQSNTQGGVSIKKIDFYESNEEVNVLDKRLNTLIEEKLSKLSSLLRFNKKVDKHALAKLQKDCHFENDLNDLMKSIKKLKGRGSGNEINMLNKKIEYLESLMAENATESELYKKYYYRCNSNKSRNSIGRFMSMGPRVFKAHQTEDFSKDLDAIRSEDSSPCRLPFFGEATSKESYKPPKKQFYNLQRSINPTYSFNNQPLPRSTYKREFLNVQAMPVENRKVEENQRLVPNFKTTLKTRYELDYQPQRVQNIDITQLDAYHDKLKFLQVSFVPSEKQKLKAILRSQEEQQQHPQVHSKLIRPEQSGHFSISKQEASFDKVRFMTQSKKAFGWYNSNNQNQRSRIKHQKLKQFEYRLKNIYKA